jgi:hypothetical protein
LKVSSTSDLTSTPIFFGPVVADAQGYVKITATGLTANSVWFYGIEINGAMDDARGKFKTFPNVGPESFEKGFS